MRKILGVVFLGATAAALGCSTSTETGGTGSGEETPGGSLNVAQGGAQDFARFRAIVEAGSVPAPETLDPVGFFAEHALDMPPADCGKDVCVHPFLAVAPRFNGGNWTMGYVTMNTAVKPDDLPHPPVHLAVVVEGSSYTDLLASSLVAPAAKLLGGLRPEDRVSVIGYEATATRFSTALAPDDASLPQAFLDAGSSWSGGGGTEVALYDGIAAAAKAFEEVDAGGFSGEHRILLLTSGHATAGITDPDLIVGLGESLARQGTAFGVVGVGEDFDETIPMALGSMGAGTYAYALDGSDLGDILEAEGQTSLLPLATDFQLQIKPAKGYRVGRIYGVHRAEATPDGATLDMPAVFIGQRSGSADVGGSRRGGGGGLFIELKATADAPSIDANQPAFEVIGSWDSQVSGGPQDFQTSLLNSLPPGKNPDGMWWSISDESNGKAFMMLNLYLAFKGVVEFYEAGDCARSLGVVDMMQTSVGAWLGKYSDTDIDSDNNLLLKLRQNVLDACSVSTSGGAPSVPTPVEPTDFEGGCGFI